ncbi:MAG TPA: nickel-binding protein [Solirubrobacterales bacterium]|nr:nickel-binding protein [Solirubrobacterales bacterium]
MPRYVIERVYDEAVYDDMEGVGARSKSIALEHFPDITWEHSHIVSDDSGIKSFCVYEAPNPERLREHGEKLGNHTITHLYEIAADVTPADFPD